MRLLNKDHYNNYKKKSKSPVSKEVFEHFLYGNGEALYDWRTREICKEFGLFQEILHEIVVSGYIFDVPHGLGSIYVYKNKTKVYTNKKGNLVKLRPIDWIETKKQGKRVYYENRHSDEYVYKIKWDKSHKHFKNKSFYLFEPSRGFKRYITFKKKENPQLDYLEYV